MGRGTVDELIGVGSREIDSSTRVCPKVNSCNNVPMVEGADTLSKSVSISSLRSTPRLSILSAPAHIPAITVVSFGDGLADPDLIRGSAQGTFPANRSDNPDWVASIITHAVHCHEMIVVEHRRRGADVMRHLHRKCLSEPG